MAKGDNSGQKWIGRNRAPRVQIEYETETNGAVRKVDLPFVMGVMSDLSGKSKKEAGPVRDRDYMEIDVDNFDDRLAAIEPRAVFQVDNVLSEDGGKIPVDLTFKSMEDFDPVEVAKNVDGVKDLLAARKELKNLMSYMDGKSSAEEWLSDVLKDEKLLKSLLESAKPSSEDSEPSTEESDK